MTKQTKNLVWLAVLTVGGFWLYSQVQAGDVAGLGQQPGWWIRRQRALARRRGGWGGGAIGAGGGGGGGSGGANVFDTGVDPDAALYATLYSGED